MNWPSVSIDEVMREMLVLTISDLHIEVVIDETFLVPLYVGSDTV